MQLLLRHPPLAVWLAAVLALAGLLLVLVRTPPIDRDLDLPAAVSQQRGAVLSFRTDLSELVNLVRYGDPELASRAAGLAEEAHRAAELSPPVLAAGYRDLADELEQLATLAATPDRAAAADSTVDSDLMEGSATPGGVSLAEQLARTLHAADRLADLTWR